MNVIKDIKNYNLPRKAINCWLSFVFLLGFVITIYFFTHWVFLALAILMSFFVGLLFTKKTIECFRLKTEFSFISHELETVLNSLNDGIIIYNPDFKIIKINSSAEKILNITKKEAVGQYISPALIKNHKLKKLAQVIFPTIAPKINQVSEGGEWPQIIEMSLDSPRLELSSTLHRLENKQENYTIFLKIIRDLTREKETIKSKKEVVTIVAHQLRTPLTAIKWELENLKQSQQNRETRNAIEKLLTMANRAINLTNGFLDIARIEEGRFDFNFQNMNLISILQEITESVVSIAKKHFVSIYFKPDFKEIIIKGDANRLNAAFLNLIDNAVRYNLKNGKVIITARKNESKKMAIIEIKDTGIGIPKEGRARVFEKLQREENATQFDPNGSGLGLFITKNIIEEHGGKISLESELNRGTTLQVTLPIIN